MSRARARLLALATAVALLTSLAPIPVASAVGSSNISGRVYHSNGITALSGVEVRLWVRTGSWSVAQTRTSAANGAYAFYPLNAGTYAVEFRDPTNAHVTEFYDDLYVPTAASATQLVMDGFNSLTTVNASMADAGAISGVVRDSSGAAVPGVQVGAFRQLGEGSFETTAAMYVVSGADGTYSLRGLGTGSYALQFWDDTYAEHYHSAEQTAGVTTKSLATPVPVSAATTTTGIDTVMLMWGAIDGTVRSASGPLDAVQVDCLRAEGTSWAPQPLITTWSVADGTFATTTRAYPGRYRVRFTAAGFPTQYHLSALTATYGVDVIVAESATTTIDSLLVAADATAPVSAITTLPSGWVRTDVTGSVTATDGADGSGVAALYWQLDAGTPVRTDGPFTISVEGEHELGYWAVDGFGNAEAPKFETVSIDKTAPVTDREAPETWRSGDVTVGLSASDALSGPDDTWYRVGTGPLTPYSTPVTVTAEGTTTVYYQSSDIAGNLEVTKSVDVRIDRTPPSTTASAAPSYVGTATISLVASDALSGVLETRWSVDGGAVHTGTVVTVTDAGDHSLEYASVDRAGNVEGTRTPVEFTVIEVDGTPPVTTLHGVPDTWTAGDVSFSMSATDTGGWGVAGSIYRLGTGSVTTYSVPVTVTAEGTTTLSYLSVDLAGNREQTRTADIRIDKTAPTMVIDADPAYLGTATVSFVASDSMSGVEHAWISVDGEETEGTTREFSILGTHTVGFRAEDAVGNVSAEVTRSVRVLPDLVFLEVAGATRFDTAVAASQRAFPSGAGTVVLATGRNWPDALGGSSLAGAVGGPVLLTEQESLPAAVAAEIGRLGATRVIALGGTGAISDNVLKQADAVSSVTQVQRVGGRDRYQTAEMVASLTVDTVGPDAGRMAVVVTGLNYPDALAASPLAASERWPVYLSGASGLSQATLDAMDEHDVTGALLLGGTGVVPSSVESGLVGVYGDAAVTRIAGANRYDTAARVASYGVAECGLAWDAVALARGDGFADALSGGPLQAVEGSVMLLTRPDVLSPEAEAVLAQNRDLIDNLRYLGGSAALSEAVRDRVVEVLRPGL